MRKEILRCFHHDSTLINHLPEDLFGLYPDGLPPATGYFTSDIPSCESGVAVDVVNRSSVQPSAQAGAVVVEKLFTCDSGESFSLYLHGPFMRDGSPTVSRSWSVADGGVFALAGNGSQASVFLGIEVSVDGVDTHIEAVCESIDPGLVGFCADDHVGPVLAPLLLWLVLEETFTGTFTTQP